jgi:hypothetical protein
MGSQIVLAPFPLLVRQPFAIVIYANATLKLFSNILNKIVHMVHLANIH